MMGIARTIASPAVLATISGVKNSPILCYPARSSIVVHQKQSNAKLVVTCSAISTDTSPLATSSLQQSTGVQNKQQAVQQLSKLFEYLERKGASIDAALDKALISLLHCPQELHEAMRYCTTADGGRHLSSLCIAACELVGGSEATALPMACSIEMWMAVILTMDDLPCLDNAGIRKGRATTHVKFGETTAVLATHALLGLAFENLINATESLGVSAETRVRLVKEFSKASQLLVWGQFEDVRSNGNTGVVDVADLNRKNVNKTSSFFELPLVAGAILGGASEQQVERLRSYGRYFGLMFQVSDDISDASMSEEEMGKDSNSDSRSGKPTYLTVLGMEKSIELRDELAMKARQELLSVFAAQDVLILLSIVEAVRRFGSIYNNSQLLEKLNESKQQA